MTEPLGAENLRERYPRESQKAHSAYILEYNQAGFFRGQTKISDPPTACFYLKTEILIRE